MIILKEFIWRKDHYAFHITNTDEMVSICKQGLKPLTGERSKSVDDDTKGIYFFDCLASASDWVDALYEKKDIYELELLKFNLKNRKWIKKNDDEFYLLYKILPERIEYLRIYNREKGIYLPLNYIDSIDEKRIIIWNSLENYKPLVKTKNPSLNI